jgi:F-type H+-transporting ATPase subunit gamma
MPTLIDFRRRIRSVKNTQQITRAMKFVAAAKLRRAQEAVFAARPYARAMRHVLSSAVARMESPQHPLLAQREEKGILAVVCSGDKGLCGAFNTNVIRRALEFLRERGPATPVEVIAVGKKCRDAFRKRKTAPVAEFLNVTSKLEFSLGRQVAAQVIERYTSGQADAVYAIYNEFKSVLIQRLTVEKILPIDPHVFESPGAQVDYIYEQAPAEILNKLLPRYVEAQVFRVMLESAAAFNAAQMTAMDAATKNAGELIESVTLHMNKVRQAGITREIIEVVSGAAAL